MPKNLTQSKWNIDNTQYGTDKNAKHTPKAIITEITWEYSIQITG